MTRAEVLQSEICEIVTITDLELRGEVFYAKSFYECRFVNCDLSEAVMENCIFSDCSFEGCNLTMVKLNHSRLSNTSFVKCKMVGVDFTAADWPEVPLKKRRDCSLKFEGCALNYSIFISMNLLAVHFDGCSLKEVGFEGADMRGASFVGCDLQGALFADTNLSKADFSEAKNYSIDVRRNNVSRAIFAQPEALSLLYALDITLQ